MAIVLLLVAFLLSSCAQPPAEEAISDPGRSIVPQPGEGIALAADSAHAIEPESDEGGLELKVRLSSEYLVSQALTVNLDLNESDEQIIVFKRRDDPDDLIRIMVVTFDPVRSNWIKAWEGATRANNVRSFTLYTDDLIGDHELELVCNGINSEGEQTLDVFRRVPDALGLGISYASIFSVAADVSIEIRELERSEAYETLQASSGRSYPIIVDRRDLESENLFDRVRTSYFWQFDAGSYVSGLVEQIPGEVVENSQLRELYSGNEADFEAFLDGPWYLASESDQEERQLLFLDVRSRSVAFHRGHLQQSFSWGHSTKTVYGRELRLHLTNESIRTVFRSITIRVLDLNRIEVIVQGSDGFEGVYRRLTGDLRNSVARSAASQARLSSTLPSGLYRNDEGDEIVFSAPEFSATSGNVTTNGGFALYELGGMTILTLLTVDSNRLPVKTVDYSVEMSEVSDDDRIIRTLLLQPGTVGLGGFMPSRDDTIEFEQVVERDEVSAVQ